MTGPTYRFIAVFGVRNRTILELDIRTSDGGSYYRFSKRCIERYEGYDYKRKKKVAGKRADETAQTNANRQ